MSDSTITYYGERGIVNGIILDIKNDIEKQKNFLRAIKLADKSSLPCVDGAIHFDWFIEPSLSQFGNPDIILTVATNTEIKYAFFIEAKINSYDSSSCPLDKDLILEKYNDGVASKLNVQLAFKYRFVEAMFANNNLSKDIKESNEVAKQYINDKQRRLYLPKLCRHLKELFSGIDKDNIYFIALIFDDKILDPFNNKKTLPAITLANWEKNKNKFGVLTYKSLESAGVINRGSGVYGKAADFMFAKLSNTDRMEYMNEQVLTSTNIQNWTRLQKHLGDYAIKVIGNTINNLKLKTPVVFKGNLKGSYSYAYKGDNEEIVLKILTYRNKEDNIVIGLRADSFSEKLEHNSERTLYLVGGGNRKPFWCYSAKNENDIDKLSEVIKKYLKAYMAHQ